jgi:hypothetical protein
MIVKILLGEGVVNEMLNVWIMSLKKKIILEKLIVVQLTKKFPSVEVRNFMFTFTITSHKHLSDAACLCNLGMFLLVSFRFLGKT